MTIAIGVVSLIFWFLSILGGMKLHGGKEHERAFKEEICSITYLYLAYLCFR